MAEELGKIEKPEVESFAGSRKLIAVPLVFSGSDAPADFTDIYNRCWAQITDQIDKLETKLGRVTRVYHEMVLSEGPEAMKVLEQLNPHSRQIVKVRTEAGAELKVVEDAELAIESLDWERCLMVAMGNRVRARVMEFHAESSKRRYDHMGRKIDETLGQEDIGLVFIREGHRLQFPADIQVFTVYPPALDEINRWLRDYSQRGDRQGGGNEPEQG